MEPNNGGDNSHPDQPFLTIGDMTSVDDWIRELGSGLPPTNTVETNAATGQPGQLIAHNCIPSSVLGHDNDIQRSLGHGMMPNQTTGHNTGQGFRSGSVLPGGNDSTAGNSVIWEQRSGSGLSEAKSKSAVHSKNFRQRKKEQEYGMKDVMEKLQEENKKLKESENESNRKLDDLRRKLCESNERVAGCQKINDTQQIQIISLSKSLENITYLEQENRRLKADKKILMLRAGRKKWVKIPIKDRIVKIKGDHLIIKMA